MAGFLRERAVWVRREVMGKASSGKRMKVSCGVCDWKVWEENGGVALGRRCGIDGGKIGVELASFFEAERSYAELFRPNLLVY
jgi:hypothetical protein